MSQNSAYGQCQNSAYGQCHMSQNSAYGQCQLSSQENRLATAAAGDESGDESGEDPSSTSTYISSLASIELHSSSLSYVDITGRVV